MLFALFRRKDAGDLGLVHEHDFFAEGKPTRQVYMIMDNAPYHKGLAMQLKSKSKAQIVDILKKKEVESISFLHSIFSESGVKSTITCHLESPFTNMATGFPTKDGLLTAALTALTHNDPFYAEPPWRRLLSTVRWGPDTADSWTVIFSPPYVPKQIAVELTWADGKNYVASPECHATDQAGVRTSQHVIGQLLHRWYSQPFSFYQSLFTHCEKEMDAWRKQDLTDGYDVILSGSISDNNLAGVPPSEHFDRWKQKAGLLGSTSPAGDDDIEHYEEDDTWATGDGTVRDHPEEGEEGVAGQDYDHDDDAV